MKRLFTILLSIALLLNIEACHSSNDFPSEPTSTIPENQAKPENMNIQITVGSATFTATLEDNQTTKAFKQMLPMTINMRDVNQNEKCHDLPTSLPKNASNPKTIQKGDLMLWGSDTVVLFYKTFTTPYSYTRLGSIHNPSGLEHALGAGNVMITFELKP
ncbi:cyclophilin-like fold protein [Neisseria sp. Ec49-e6-T10]|uniref:cyclophilin-like fold protein n=1 Tax=Neisseria sp. Ec49-e6-T10 TaxID=3140744 RepID=UPI003EBA3CB0